MAYETSWNLPMSSEAVSLDGEYIENHVSGYHTINVSGRESLEYRITDEDRPVGMDGMEYYGKRQGGRTLTVRFALTAPTAAEFMVRFRKLKNFCKGENRVIRFADEPNAHYTGTLEAIEPPDEGQLNIMGEMRFYCADPYLVSDLITTVAAQTEGEKLVAHIDNDGSGEVYPLYRIKHKAENGYIGIVHTRGAFEMGNIEEADKEPYEQSEQLVKGFENFSPYTGTDPQNPTIPLNGSLRQSGDYLEIENIGSTTQQWNWHGGSHRLKLPPDSEGEIGARNFYCWWQSDFVAGRMGQTGFQQVILTDENDEYLCHWQITKSDNAGNTAYVSFGIPGAAFKDFSFAPYADESNQYLTRGYEDIQKLGSQLRFYFDGSYYTVDVPEIRDKKVTYIYIVIGGLANRAGLLAMTVNKVGRFSATKHHVEKERDIPNRYQGNSEVVINCESDSITVRGLPRNDEMVTGSAFYPLSPGETDIEFYVSSWCKEPPEITVEYRKRWL